MNRREFLQCVAILASGTSLSQLGFALSEKQQKFLRAAPSFTARTVDYFTAHRRELVSAIAEVIIPRTETPGAIDAGVPHFIEMMVGEWLNDQEKAVFTAGIQEMETAIPARYGASFQELKNNQQLEILEGMESAARESSWYQFGNVRRDFISDAPFICQMKELTIWGFFTSEVGSKQVLRHNPMPMRFDGDVPLLPDESTWSRTLG